jgi:hypothetical protein
MNLTTLVRAGLLTAAIDGLFSSILSAFFYGSTVARLWQGVASVLLGPGAMTGGTRTVLIGLLMHVAVAFTWSAVFLLLAGRIAPVRRILTSRSGALAVAAVYGPFIWLVMSLAVIPAMTHRPAAVNFRWWVQFFGHIPFVALPIAVVARHHLSTRRQTRA